MLKITNISKSFKGFSLRNISLTVSAGDYFVLLGKSGSGKSLLLEIISGISRHESGSIFLNNLDISNQKIQDRNIIMVCQDPALFPHMSVYANIMFTLKCHHISPKEASERIHEIAEQMSIKHLLRRKTINLSGGESQRVALARALVVKPYVLLLDEPLTALDAHLKGEMQALLHKINRYGQTIIHVTHDFEEAVSLSNKIAVIDNGEILQQGFTEEIVKNPTNDFVAQLTGIKNFFSATLNTRNHDDDLQDIVVDNCKLVFKTVSDRKCGKGFLSFDAKDVFLSENSIDTSAVNSFPAEVINIIPRLNGVDVVLDAGVKVSAFITRHSLKELQIVTGKTMWFSLKASALDFICTEQD